MPTAYSACREHARKGAPERVAHERDEADRHVEEVGQAQAAVLERDERAENGRVGDPREGEDGRRRVPSRRHNGRRWFRRHEARPPGEGSSTSPAAPTGGSADNAGPWHTTGRRDCSSSAPGRRSSASLGRPAGGA